MSFLEVLDMSFSYNKKNIFSNFSLSLEKGDHLVVTGASGRGKSTLLRILAGLENPDQGQIKLSGRTLFDDSNVVAPHEREIGMVFQDYALFPHMTIKENVEYANPRLIQAQEWLRKVKLENKLNSYPRELSGGEQQRVALVRTLAAKPRLVLLDEPFSSLDPELREELELLTYELLNEFNISSIQVTHQLNKEFSIPRKIIAL